MRVGLETKGRIINSFSKLLREKDVIEEVNIKEILKEAKVAPTTFFYHFKNKKSLLKELLNLVWKVINRKVQNELRSKLHTQQSEYDFEYYSSAVSSGFLEDEDKFFHYMAKDSVDFFEKAITVFRTIANFVNSERDLSKVLFNKETENIRSREFIKFIRFIDDLIQEGNTKNIFLIGTIYHKIFLSEHFRKLFRTVLLEINRDILTLVYKEIITTKEAEETFMKFLMSFLYIDKRSHLETLFTVRKLDTLLDEYNNYGKRKNLQVAEDIAEEINNILDVQYLYLHIIKLEQYKNIAVLEKWYDKVSTKYPKLIKTNPRNLVKTQK